MDNNSVGTGSGGPSFCAHLPAVPRVAGQDSKPEVHFLNERRTGGEGPCFIQTGRWLKDGGEGAPRGRSERSQRAALETRTLFHGSTHIHTHCCRIFLALARSDHPTTCIRPALDHHRTCPSTQFVISLPRSLREVVCLWCVHVRILPPARLACTVRTTSAES